MVPKWFIASCVTTERFVKINLAIPYHLIQVQTLGVIVDRMDAFQKMRLKNQSILRQFMNVYNEKVVPNINSLSHDPLQNLR